MKEGKEPQSNSTEWILLWVDRRVWYLHNACAHLPCSDQRMSACSRIGWPETFCPTGNQNHADAMKWWCPGHQTGKDAWCDQNLHIIDPQNTSCTRQMSLTSAAQKVCFKQQHPAFFTLMAAPDLLCTLPCMTLPTGFAMHRWQALVNDAWF